MLTGKNIQELAAELQRQQDAKLDLIADTRNMEMEADGNLTVVADQVHRFGLNDNAHRQIATRLQIPQKYYDRMRAEQPVLLADNVNTWFEKNPEKRMVRTLDGDARAFLSDRYQRIDNLALMARVLPVLHGLDDFQVQSCEVTARRMYIQIVVPTIQAEVKVGDVVQAGFVIGNSEIGLGSVFVDQLVWRLICLNGMRRGHSVKKYHVGGRQDEGVLPFLTDETLRLEDDALTSKLRDVMQAAITTEALEMAVAPLREATERSVENVVKASEVLSNKIGLTGGEGDAMLQHLIAGGDLSQYGMANAVTRLAHDSGDYDRAFELEGLGGRVIDLSATDWSDVAQAA